MTRPIAVLAALLVSSACENNQKTPTPPPPPDMGLAQTDTDTAKAADGGTADVAAVVIEEDTLPPIGDNLINFIPETLDGVKARRRQVVQSAPIVHGFYPGEKSRIYNLHITGPNKSESERREMYPLLGKDESSATPKAEIQGFKLAGFDAQRSYQPKKQKAETVVLVNPFVEVRLSVAPTKDKEAATKLLEKEIDLAGVSKLR